MANLSAIDSISHYGPIVVLLVMAILFGVGNVVLTTVLGPRSQGPVKGMAYESGMNPFSSARRRFHVRFYVVAMTFLLFDVEIVFLYPWAVVFGSLADESALRPLFLGRVLFFLLTSVVAFTYAWRKGVFQYD